MLLVHPDCKLHVCMDSMDSFLMTTAQFESAVTWIPRGQADNWCRREWVLRQHVMRISKAMPLRGPMYARSFSIQLTISQSLSCHAIRVATPNKGDISAINE